MRDRCRTCKAEIRWAISVHGRPMILDREPADNGTIRLAAARVPGGTPRAIIVPEDQRAGLAGELYVDHHANCPHADQHRRRRR